MPYILTVEAQSTAKQTMDTGEYIEVTNGTARKTILVESVSRHRVTVYWPMAGQYDIDLITGELKSRVIPVNGVFSVDCLTGRVQGTRCTVCAEDMLRLEELRPGDQLRLEHDASGAVQVDVVDALPSEAVLKIFVRTRRDSWSVDRPYATGWRVSMEALRALRERAGVSLVAQAS